MKYSIHALSEALIDDVVEYASWNGKWIEFDDCVVSVWGWAREDYEVIEGDYWTPPEYNLVDRACEFEKVLIDEKEMSQRELDQLEELIRV